MPRKWIVHPKVWTPRFKETRYPVKHASIGRGKWLAGLIRHYKWNHGVEVGVFRGENLFYLLDNCPDLHMVAVDAWRHRPECGRRRHGAAHSKVDMNACYENVVKQSLSYANRVVVLKEESVVAADQFGDETFDFVFIDASHDEQSVMEDIAAWKPKVKSGGYVTGHDYVHPGVLPAVRRSFPKGVGKYVIDNCWFWQKP